MRRLGYFIHRSSTGKLVVKLVSPRPPKIGVRVLNSKGRVVGRVIDVIGPVRSPYAIVKPTLSGVKLREYEELYLK